MDIKSLIRTIPDFPKPGIQFRDITTLIKDPAGFRQVIKDLAEHCKQYNPDAIVGIEARGFILGAAIAYELGLGFVPIRKKGKLPGETYSQTYDLEYGHDEMEIHKDALKAGQKVVLVDDLLATGGTALGAVKLLKNLDVKVSEFVVVVELPELGGRKKVEADGHDVYTMVTFEGH